MDLERLAVRLRPRRDWEAADLGLTLVRAWWRRVYGAWLPVAVPAALLLVLALGGWGLLVFWWLLPLGEAVVLFVLSRAVFGSPPSRGEVFRALPGIWRRALPEIGLRRLHPERGLRLAIGQLERLRGAPWRRRAAVLSSLGEGVPAWLSPAFLLFEIGLGAGLIVFAVLMTPSWAGFDWELFGERLFAGALPGLAYDGFWLLWAATAVVLDPFYVGAGFALYLNRRTALEGWDLEIAFRRLARRLRARHAAAVALLALGLAAGSPAGAQEAETMDVESLDVESLAAEGPAPPLLEPSWKGDPARHPRRVIDEVLARPELSRKEIRWRWQLRSDFEAKERPENPLSAAFKDFFLAVARFLAVAGEALLWLLAIVVVALLARAAWRRWPRDAVPERAGGPAPERLFGLDLRPESLPADVPAAAEDLWREGRAAEALSLLYRAALARLAEDGLELRSSFTEGDCLRAARRRLATAPAGYFAELTGAWQSVAYAHRVPETARARGLWSRWSEHFGGRG